MFCMLYSIAQVHMILGAYLEYSSSNIADNFKVIFFA